MTVLNCTCKGFVYLKELGAFVETKYIGVK